MLMHRKREHHGDDRGASAIEYGILLALIAAVIVLAVAALGADTGGGLQTACQEWDRAAGGAGVCN